MERRSIAFEQLSDIYGFRSSSTRSPTVTRRRRGAHDMAMRSGALQGLHLDAEAERLPFDPHHRIGPGSQRVELQIRTHEMHEVAEYGIAAHTIYKDGRRRHAGRQRKPRLSGPTGRRSRRSPSDNSEKFLEHTKLELFHDQVFCFTPKGRLIALPRGATAIDFAYAVHTDIGNSAVGCKINGRIAPLISVLQNGDEVQISRSASGLAAGRLGQRRRHGPRPGRDPPRDARSGQGAVSAASGGRSSNGPSSGPGKKFTEAKLKAALPRLARA